jgi:hypothetical protein
MILFVGGAQGVNPFRQPRAMPTPLLLLPQCSNGFFYGFNVAEEK